MKLTRRAAVLAAWLSTAVLANEVPLIDGQRALPADQLWQQHGSGQTRLFGFTLYEASFWTAQAPSGAHWRQTPHALLLRYQRDFSGETLVDASLREMKRLGSTEADLARWKAPLSRVFPNVKAGETITGIHHPGQGALFLHQARSTGQIDDPELARQFFAIWLDPRSRDPELRKRLLGPLGSS